MKLAVVQFLVESRSADLYHGTSLVNANKILQNNTLFANTPIHSLNVPQQHKGNQLTVSLSRDIQVAINFARANASDNKSLPVVFILDQGLLYRDLGKRMRPYDDMDSMEIASRRGQGHNEREEAVFGNITNLNKYIKRIVISVPSTSAPVDDEYSERSPLTDRRLAATELKKYQSVANNPHVTIRDMLGKQFTYRSFMQMLQPT